MAAGKPNMSEKPKQAALVRKGRPTPKTKYPNHAFMNPDGSVDGERLLALVNRSPGGFELIMLDALLDRGYAAQEYHAVAEEIVSALLTIIALAGHGDEQSEMQLKALRKLVKPRKYEIPISKIREIAERYETSPPLARGWELHKLMSNLSLVVEPLKKDRAYTANQPIAMRLNPPAVFVGLSDLARQHVKPNTTLQSLAIHIYLEHLQKEGITDENEAINERSLKRDLQRVREWEKSASGDEKVRRGRMEGASLGEEPITWYMYSEGWKERKKKRSKKLLKR
jgi:hypothetical protein